MLLHVVHETRYAYEPAVKNAQHMAHLKPRASECQQLLSHELRVLPEPERQVESMDVFGNTRTFFSLPAAHQRLTVVADSLVSTCAPVRPESDLSWEQVRERFRYHAGAAYDPAAEFAFASPYVPRHEDFVSYARPSFAAGTGLLAAAHSLMERMHEDFAYESESTEVSTPALEALQLRRGVCQDFAQVMVACFRSMGLPARYVSGYLLTEPPPGRPRLVGADASHAWASLYVPQAGWCDFDPTNNRAPGEDYVTLAIGRDYSDVSPIRGVLHGGAHHTLRVGVTVSPVEDETSDGGAPTIADQQAAAKDPS
jgi:transglutaminase-like putative cysteine protease